MSTENATNDAPVDGIVVRLFSWLFPPKDPMPMPPKDPMDWKLTKNSGEWWTDQYCPCCKKSTGHREKMARICNGCGHHGNMMRYRSSRKIWNGTKWVIQRKYSNGPSGYEIDE